MGDESTIDILEDITLMAFVSVRNSFGGAFMTLELRKWIVEVDLRFEPRVEFRVEGASLEEVLREAQSEIYKYYDKYNKWEQFEAN